MTTSVILVVKDHFRPYNIFYGDDPLWDGAGCGPNNDCCTLNNPPWFHKQLPSATADDIEMRLCCVRLPVDEDTPVACDVKLILWQTDVP